MAKPLNVQPNVDNEKNESGREKREESGGV